MTRDASILRLAVTALAGGALAAAAPAPAQAPADCAECHDEVKVAAFSVHRETGCAECHSDIQGHPHPDPVRKGAAVCAGCHDAGEKLAASAHAKTGCLECHGAAHEIRAMADPQSPMAAVRQIPSCGRCHGGAKGELVAGYVNSVHGRGLVISGLVVAPSCSGCHGAHDIAPHSRPESRVSHKNVPTTCGGCHKGILDTWREASAHGAAWLEGDGSAPVCTRCHASHAVEEPRERRPRLASPGVCADCHQEAFETYRESFHGKASNLGYMAVAVCSDCHTPHANLPASDPRASIHADNLDETCGRCHPGTPASFTTFESHSNPSSPAGNKAVHYIWLFMTILLVSVFSFFGLHMLLWLQRSVVAGLRREFHHEEHEELHEKWVRRFKPVHRWTHLTIVVTFLLLAATGLPLKFHFTAWAQAVFSGPGSVELTRWLHRVAAMLTFGYALLHLSYIVRRVAGGDRGLLYGWASMTPAPRDLRDLYANLRYFLYLGPRPRFDRFTYWEKFDYFAVFWGIPVIGLSGLMLWFPDFFTRFLPGWALNAAFVIHSDEALLATGFIFIFHFFHTHLRPESFPLDPVIFTGSMPLSRFKEERLDEYERLVATNQLEAHLVPAPTPERLRNIALFGLTAVTIGLLLAVGIIVGVLF